MKAPALFLLDPALCDRMYGPAERAQLEQHLAFVGPPLAPSAVAGDGRRLREVEVIVSSWGMPRLDENFLARCPKLRAVFYGAGSIRSFVTEASWARGVRVISAADANAVSAAEFSFAQIILGLKQAWPLALATRRQRRFVRPPDTMAGTYGGIVGLLALGRIGRLVAERLRTLDVEVLAYDPMITPEEAHSLGATLCSLDEVFARADVVSCHLPLLAETRHLLRAPHFRALKSGASFINTARGGVVAEEELVRVLRERPDIFAVLDVTDPEPPPSPSPLYELPNVMLTPHIAGCVGAEARRLGAAIVMSVGQYVRGEPVANEVTRALAETLA